MSGRWDKLEAERKAAMDELDALADALFKSGKDHFGNLIPKTQPFPKVPFTPERKPKTPAAPKETLSKSELFDLAHFERYLRLKSLAERRTVSYRERGSEAVPAMDDAICAYVDMERESNVYNFLKAVYLVDDEEETK